MREIGIRVALGADAGQVLRAVLGRMAALLGGGLVAGLAAGAAGLSGSSPLRALRHE